MESNQYILQRCQFEECEATIFIKGPYCTTHTRGEDSSKPATVATPPAPAQHLPSNNQILKQTSTQPNGNSSTMAPPEEKLGDAITVKTPLTSLGRASDKKLLSDKKVARKTAGASSSKPKPGPAAPRSIVPGSYFAPAGNSAGDAASDQPPSKRQRLSTDADKGEREARYYASFTKSTSYAPSGAGLASGGEHDIGSAAASDFALRPKKGVPMPLEIPPRSKPLQDRNVPIPTPLYKDRPRKEQDPHSNTKTQKFPTHGIIDLTEDDDPQPRPSSNGIANPSISAQRPHEGRAGISHPRIAPAAPDSRREEESIEVHIPPDKAANKPTSYINASARNEQNRAQKTGPSLSSRQPPKKTHVNIAPRPAPTLLPSNPPRASPVPHPPIAQHPPIVQRPPTVQSPPIIQRPSPAQHPSAVQRPSPVPRPSPIPRPSPAPRPSPVPRPSLVQNPSPVPCPPPMQRVPPVTQPTSIKNKQNAPQNPQPSSERPPAAPRQNGTQFQWNGPAFNLIEEMGRILSRAAANPPPPPSTKSSQTATSSFPGINGVGVGSQSTPSVQTNGRIREANGIPKPSDTSKVNGPSHETRVISIDASTPRSESKEISNPACPPPTKEPSPPRTSTVSEPKTADSRTLTARPQALTRTTEPPVRLPQVTNDRSEVGKPVDAPDNGSKVASMVRNRSWKHLSPEERRQVWVAKHDPDKFDSYIYGKLNEANRPGSALFGLPEYLQPPRPTRPATHFGHIDPRIHWTRRRSEKWHREKQNEIRRRGTRKSNFGQVAARIARKRRDEGENAPRIGLPERVRKDPAWLAAIDELDEMAEQYHAKMRKNREARQTNAWKRVEVRVESMDDEEKDIEMHED